MNVIWHKLWSDLWDNKLRTMLAVFSIAAGTFSVGVVFGQADQLLSGMDAAHEAVNPSHLNMILNQPIDRETATRLKTVPGVKGIEQLNMAIVRYKTDPEADWLPGLVVMRDDYDEMAFDLLQLKKGVWPKRNKIGIDRSASDHFNINIGDKVIFELEQTNRALEVSGRIRHPFVPPPAFGGEARFFVDAHGAERFGIKKGAYGQLLVQVEPYSQALAEQVASDIKQRLAKLHVGVAAVVYQSPHKHWGRMFVEGFNVVLQLLAVVSLFVSGILVTNTFTALITAQINQIGMIKAIGGSSWVIFKVYLAGVIIYGTLAFLVAVLPSAYLAYLLTKLFLNLFNIDYELFTVSWLAIGLQAGAALLTPIVAASIPIMKGTNTTVREAIASYGLGGSFGQSRFDRLVDAMSQRFFSSFYALSINNMFRKKERLILTQIVLITAGTMFLAVVSLADSTDLTVTNDLNRRQFDLRINFDARERASRLEQIAQTLPEVVDSEVWYVQAGSLLKQGQRLREAGAGVNVTGLPLGSPMYQPLITAGRWLQPGDGNALVIYQDLADEQGVGVGDWVTLDLGEFGHAEWRIVGVFQTVLVDSFGSDPVYAPLTALAQATKKHNRGNQIVVRTSIHETETEAVIALSNQLKMLYEEQQREVALGGSRTTAEERQFADSQFALNINSLLALAVILAGVGGIGLTGALSISVVERTREIGVMRAVGAKTSSILSMLLMEGLLQGLLSWAISIPLSFIIGPPFANLMGQVMLGINLDFAYSYPAILIWLGIVTVVSISASVLPARSGTQISVRESLAYV